MAGNASLVGTAARRLGHSGWQVLVEILVEEEEQFKISRDSQEILSKCSTYSKFASALEEGVQLVATIELRLGGRESGRLLSSNESDLVALGRASVRSAAAEDGALERGLVAHPPEGGGSGQVAGHVAHIVQVTNVSLHEGAADQQKAH